MSVYLRSLTTLGLTLCLAGASVRADEKSGEMVENPFYKHWGSFKPGSTAVCLETTKLGHKDSKLWTPDGVEEKRITHKLVEVNDKHVVVETVVTERTFVGSSQTSPTRHIYPAKVRKQDLEQFLQETGAKTGEDVAKVDGKELKTRTLAGTIKAPGGEETEYKIWFSDEVPGCVVKKVRTTRNKGEVIAETTITLESCKKGD